MKALLLGRIEYLATGPLGHALLGASSSGIDWADLLSRPTVIELKTFAGPQERALMFALLMAGLVSYRESHPTPDRLSHVTVLEEAHRFLSADSGNSEGVRLFADAIAELRGSGEGFIVVDQAPSMLHPSVTKFTGSKIAHRLVEPEERAAIGSSMLLDARQQEDLARLPSARAIVFTSEAEGPVVVDIVAHTNTRVERVPADGTSLGRTRSFEPLFCLGCRFMCYGEAGAASLGGHLESIRYLAGRELLERAWELSGQRPATARCLSARVAAVRHVGNIGGLRTELDAIDQHLEVRMNHEKGAELS